MDYFQYQSVVPYTFTTGGVTTTMSIVNITQRAKIKERLRQHTTAMHDYVIAEGERPDTVAMNLYGDAKYTWVVLLMNDIVSLYDWPMMNSEFELYLIGKYGSLSDSQNQGTRTDAAWSAAKFYYTTEGDRVDATTYAGLGARQGTTNTPYTQEVEDNDTKRRIKVAPASVLAGLDNALKTLYRT